jgi:hypothetical protein
MTYFEQYGGTKKPPITSTKFSVVNGLGEQASFAFLANSGPGKIVPTGGIVPIRPNEAGPGAAPSSSIFINMPDDSLKEFCLIGRAYAEQFIGLDLQTKLSIVRDHRQSYKDQQLAKLGY